MTAPICRVCPHGRTRLPCLIGLGWCDKYFGLPKPVEGEEPSGEPREGNKPSGGLSASPGIAPAQSEWLRNVLEHCDRATSTSLATMRALGKDSTKIRKAVGK